MIEVRLDESHKKENIGNNFSRKNETEEGGSKKSVFIKGHLKNRFWM